jgi:outer membrane protein insertion porin family
VIAEGKVVLIFRIEEEAIVRSIEFIGNRTFKAKTLRKKALLRVGEYLEGGPGGAERGRAALEEYYLKKGFAFAQVGLDSNSEQLLQGRLIYRITEGPRVKIKSVRFSGNSALKARTLRKAIKTDEKKWLLWRRDYSERAVERDIRGLQRLYYQRGFLDSKITAEREFNAKSDRVRLTFVISEGPAYTVERIILAGTQYLDQKKIRAELKLQEGQIYNDRTARLDVQRVLRVYRQVGFIDVKVEQSRRFISKDRVNVEYEIAEGEQFRIGRVDITGNKETKDKVIRRVLDEYDFMPGKWYNAEVARGDGSGDLERDVRRRIMAEEATITPSGETPGRRDAKVQVQEALSGWISPGVAAYSDTGLAAHIIYREENFDIKDWPKSISDIIPPRAFKGGGKKMQIGATVGTIWSRFWTDFTDPYWKDKPIEMNLGGMSDEWEREAYDEGKLKAHIGFAQRYQQRYADRWRRNIRFRLENVDVKSLDSDAPKEVVDDKGDNVLAGVKVGIRKDNVDRRFNPTTGWVLSANYEQVGGDHTFGKAGGTYKRYRTLSEDFAGRKTVLATRLHGSTIVGDAPVFEKYYAGGSGFYGIRGFDYRGVSTRGLQRNVASPKRKDPIGSDWIFLVNAEVIVPLVREDIAALFFVDSGAIDSGNYRVSVGAGIQIQIPQWFGPMRFELGLPVMKDGEDDTQVFSFSGGWLF